MSTELVTALVELDEDSVVNEVRALKQSGTPALDILAFLQQGMEEIGRKFETNEYFLSELIMSGDIFKSATDELGDTFFSDGTQGLGTIVIGTVKEDIHDIGKDIVVTILSCNGFNVIDLGVDVPVQKFVEAVQQHNPQVIGMSCLLTSAFDSMKDTVLALEQAGLREGRKILIGGGPIDAKVAAYVKADGYCTSAQEAVEMCKKIVSEN